MLGARAHLKDTMLWVMVGVLLAVTISNVTTIISDAARAGAPVPWQRPVLTEVSSAVGAILMMPFLFAFFERLPLRTSNWISRLPAYMAVSMAFSAGHVFIMVMIRKAFWPVLFNAPYEFFGRYGGEAFYEYRKDAVTFLIILLLYTLERQVAQARAAKAAPQDPVLLKSGSTTILLQPSEFLYAKSAGNYAEVTSAAGTQLARVTLTELEALLREKGCDAARIHRSYIVNKAAITETAPIAGGDLNLKLRNGETLRASRRYRDKLEQQ